MAIVVIITGAQFAMLVIIIRTNHENREEAAWRLVVLIVITITIITGGKMISMIDITVETINDTLRLDHQTTNNENIVRTVEKSGDAYP